MRKTTIAAGLLACMLFSATACDSEPMINSGSNTHIENSYIDDTQGTDTSKNTTRTYSEETDPAVTVESSAPENPDNAVDDPFPDIPETPAGELEYYKSSYHDEEIIVITGYNGTDETIRFPESIDGIPVTSIEHFDGSLEQVKTIVVPKSLASYYGGMFQNCRSLETVYFCWETDDYVLAISFSGCKNLKNIYVPEGNSSFCDIDGVLFSKDKEQLFSYPMGRTETSYTVPDSVKELDAYAFKGNEHLSSITLPAGIEYVLPWALSDMPSLTDIIIDGSSEIFSVKDGVLYSDGGTSLCAYPAGLTSEEFVIPEGVTGVLNSAFSGTEHLRSLTIPRSMTIINDGAFSNMYGLERVVIPDSVTTIQESFYNCTSLKEAVIPDSVISISGSFRECTSLERIEIPDSVTELGGSVFENCTALSDVVLSKNITSLGYCDFGGCTGLKNISLPDGMTQINDTAFYGCTGLNITFRGKTYQITEETNNYMPQELIDEINGVSAEEY